MSNVYWNGAAQATLTRSQVHARWGAAGVEHSGASISFTNRAFEVYYLAHQRISACPDSPHKERMFAELHDAGETGWGWGVDDLKEAFNHLTANGGNWTDNETSVYFGGPNKLWQGALVVTAPVSAVAFMNAVDSRLARLRDILERYNLQVRQASEAERTGNWERLGSVLSEIEDWGERAKPLVWMAPTVERRLGQVVGYASVLSNIHSGLTTYSDAIGAGFPPGAATALGGLRAALGWVPVLGDFYGRAVELIPGLTRWFRNLVDDYCRRIDRASTG